MAWRGGPPLRACARWGDDVRLPGLRVDAAFLAQQLGHHGCDGLCAWCTRSCLHKRTRTRTRTRSAHARTHAHAAVPHGTYAWASPCTAWACACACACPGACACVCVRPCLLVPAEAARGVLGDRGGEEVELVLVEEATAQQVLVALADELQRGDVLAPRGERGGGRGVLPDGEHLDARPAHRRDAARDAARLARRGGRHAVPCAGVGGARAGRAWGARRGARRAKRGETREGLWEDAPRAAAAAIA